MQNNSCMVRWPDIDMYFAPADSRLDRDPSAPMLWAVWYPCSDEADDFDILGAGNTPEEAIADARRTVAGWSK